MCGIVGVVGHHPGQSLLYDALQLLQHRGQDAAGIATGAGSTFFNVERHGLVREIFRTRNMRNPGRAIRALTRSLSDRGLGQQRGEAQPFTSTRRRDHTRHKANADQHRGADAGDVPQGRRQHQHAI